MRIDRASGRRIVPRVAPRHRRARIVAWLCLIAVSTGPYFSVGLRGACADSCCRLSRRLTLQRHASARASPPLGTGSWAASRGFSHACPPRPVANHTGPTRSTEIATGATGSELRHDARDTAAALAAGAVNDDARVATQHATAAGWHEVLVDRSRHKHGDLP